eukprot:COSAG05_NODE_4678_length_1414_cov_1.482129_2_plen_48_part_00
MAGTPTDEATIDAASAVGGASIDGITAVGGVRGAPSAGAMTECTTTS